MKFQVEQITFFVVGTKNIDSSTGVTSQATGLIKINKNEDMCFTNDNMKNHNTQKEEMKASETKICPARLRHMIGIHKTRIF